MNNCAFIGRLTADIEIRRTNSGKAVASYSLAVKRPRVADTTDFIEFVSWEQAAEYLGKYAHKGDIVGAVGTLQPREWTDKDGNKRKAWEVVTTSVELLSSKKESQGNNQTAQNQNGFQGGYSGPQQGYSQPQQGFQGQQYNQGFGNYQQQGFGGYHAPQQNDYPQLDGDDPKLPF
jgi:single-strand DNA-binding protein